MRELHFDPAAQWHTYTLGVNMEEDNPDDLSWQLVLQIDGEVKAMLGGASAVSQLTLVQLAAYNRHGELAMLQPLQPAPTATALFYNLRLSSCT